MQLHLIQPIRIRPHTRGFGKLALSKSPLIYGKRCDANALEAETHQQRLSEVTATEVQKQ